MLGSRRTHDPTGNRRPGPFSARGGSRAARGRAHAPERRPAVADQASGCAGPAARRPGRGGARYFLRREGRQGLDRSLAPAHHPGRGSTAHEPRGQRVGSRREPGREVGRLRSETRGGRERADLPPPSSAAARRGASRTWPMGASAPKWFPDSRRVAFVSRVWTDLATWDEMEKRQKERKDSKMTARVFDQAARPLLGPLARRPRGARLYGRHRGRRAPGGHARGTGLELPRQEAGAGSYDISPDGAEIAFTANSDKTGIEPERGRVRGPGRGRDRAQPDGREQGQRRRAAL